MIACVGCFYIASHLRKQVFWQKVGVFGQMYSYKNPMLMTAFQLVTIGTAGGGEPLAKLTCKKLVANLNLNLLNCFQFFPALLQDVLIAASLLLTAVFS